MKTKCINRLFVCIIFFGFYFTYNAQQNIFNVPSSEITEKNKVFFQQQFNVNDLLQSNTNFCFGLGSGWELGMNIIGVVSDYKTFISNDKLGEGSITPTLMATMQKLFKLSKNIHLGLGTEIGCNALSANSQNTFLSNFSYLNSNISFFDDKLHIISGIYYANKAYQGEESGFGVMMGYEYKLSKKTRLVGDWISGDNYIGVAAIGGQYFVSPKIPLSLGLQLPNSKQKNNYGVVFEFTYLPKT